MVDSESNETPEARPDDRERRGGEPPPRFIIAPDDVRDGVVRLSGAEGHHAKNVVRLGRGDFFVAVDGRGAEYEAQVEIRTADGLLGKVLRTTRRSREPIARVTLAQALLKPGELAEVVKQGTALGVAEFAFFECARAQRSELAPREVAHLKGVAAAAVKQSLRAVLPKISGPENFARVLARAHEADVALLCNRGAGAEPLADVVSRTSPAPSRFLVAVGPEGGFDADEEERAAASAFRPLDLGPRRLRAELAGPVACALVLYAAGDLGPAGRGR
jgi:16S rRNA (uracil1498-N3)-methyltransferase